MAGVDGLVSGMDTTAVIQQLLQLERMPQARLEQQQKAYETKVASYQSVNAKLLTLQTASDALAKASTWSAFKVASSSTSVSGTASTSALSGSYSFEVIGLAKAHAELSSHVFTSTAERAAVSASTITITKDDGTTPMVVDTGEGSLATIVANINAGAGGVKAAAVQVAPGQYRLSLTSTTTGEDSSFSVAGLDHATQDLVVGANAQLGMGTPTSLGPPPVYDITIESPSNTFTDVLPGVTFTVSKLEEVTLDVTADSAGIANKVLAMVTAANAVLDEIAKQTVYNSTTKAKSPLTGDSTVRSLQQRILSMGAGYGNVSLADVGLEVTKAGRFEFAADAFQTAYAADPAGTAALFRPGGAMAPTDPAGVAFLSAGDRTVAGPHAVAVTRTAAKALVTVSGSVTDGDTFEVRVPGGDPIVVTAAGDTLETMVDRLNAAVADEGMDVIAGYEGGALVMRSTIYGTVGAFSLDVTSATATASSNIGRLSGLIAGTETVRVSVPGFSDLDVAAQVGDNVAALAARMNASMTAAGLGLVAVVRHEAIVLEGSGGVPASFEVTTTGGTLEAHVAGIDVEGTIGGVAATGMGQVLTASTSDVTLDGLSLTVTAAAPMSGTLTYVPGLAQRFDSLAGDAIRTDSGFLTTVITGGERAADLLQDQIEGWDRRLQIRETMLRRQFASLETALGNMRNKSSWLAGQLGSLNANNG